MKYEIYAPYIYWKCVGTVNAPTEEEALEKAWDELEIEDADSLCWHCEEDMMDHPMLDFTTGIHAECLGEE
jgi:hypothetical protein